VALVSDLIAVGFSVAKAKAVGDSYEKIVATGSTSSDAAPATSSIIFVSGTTGVNAGIKLPKMDASNTKRHVIINASGGAIKVYVGDSTTETFLIAGAAASASFTLADTASKTITKIANNEWVAY